MAITIIKNTMVDPIEMTCECCKSVFTYNFQDIQRREERILFGMNSTIKRVVTCPVCKYDNDVNRVMVELSKDKELEEKEYDGSDEHCRICKHRFVTPEDDKICENCYGRENYVPDESIIKKEE